MKKGSFDLTGKAVDCSGLIALGDSGKEIFRALKVAVGCESDDEIDFSSLTSYGAIFKEDTGFFDMMLCSYIHEEGLESIQPSDVLGQPAINAAMDGATIVFEGDDVPNVERLLYWSDGSRSIHAQTKGCELVAYKPLCEQPSIESRILAEKTGSKTNSAVSNPSHYQLFPEYEVKDVNKALLDKIQVSGFDLSLYEAGWYQQSMQYFMRFYAKNGLEDLEKGVQTMQFVIDSIKGRQ